MQAKRIKTFSDFKHPKAKSGCTVKIKVPNVNRTKTDGRSVLAVALQEIEDGFYKLGTKSGILKQLHNRSQFSFCKEKFVDKEDLPEDEISLRQTTNSQSISNGQGFQKCNCRSKCVTIMGACRKNKILSNSKCHQSLSCNNKINDFL